MRLLACIAALILAGAGHAAAVSPPSDAAVAKAVRKALEQAAAPEGPGVVALVAKGDRVVYREARGLAQLELGVPLTTQHVFRIASVTKIFTAATVLKLAEQGKLSLDDPLAAHLPDFPHAGEITLRQLLNHTAGVSDAAADPQPGFSRREIDTATLIAEIGKRPLDFAPGTRWAYSNAGYVLLGAVIEKVTGEPWHVAMQKLFAQPLDLRDTRYGDESTLIPRRVAGYTTDSRSRVVRNPVPISSSIPAAAGGLVSTADDLLRWMRALADGSAVGRQGFAEMIAPPDLPQNSERYGLGMYLWTVRGQPMVGHTGQINGFSSILAYLPEQDITIVALANDDHFDAKTMGRRLAAIALGDPYADVMPVSPSPEALRTLAGTYRYDENTLQTLSVRDGKLYSQRQGRGAIPLQVDAGGRLYFVPDEISYFVPVRDAHGNVIRLDFFRSGEGPPRAMPRVDPPAR
ncbi:beta-lactamase family protein [Luteimonas sp. SX5]|uniref:Beta-lactamase family protein n=1 Tax=Luteimonas galliterrae TaxID=2940486 RepID=A0ABT0MFG3_9GAMM|nr:serine hydrolase domain-containing protein [Luteimonas galliterrae]MCL1633614.1 beta-lactamase family protein [Luteimonas galliterrae]